MQKYTIELYGVQADGKQETIRLASGVDLADRVKFDNAGRYTLELCVDDDLAEGSKSWKYNNVILHVARVSDTNAADRPGRTSRATPSTPGWMPPTPPADLPACMTKTAPMH